MPKPAQPDIAALISRAEAADLSRSEIARRSGLTRSAITRLACGDRGCRRPSLGTYLALKGLVDALPDPALTIVNK